MCLKADFSLFVVKVYLTPTDFKMSLKEYLTPNIDANENEPIPIIFKFIQSENRFVVELVK